MSIVASHFSKLKVLTNSVYDRLWGIPYVSDSEINGEIIRKYIGKENPIILDIGCNDGFNTLWFFKIFEKPKVYCFEPDPRAIARFKRKVGQNPNIQLSEIALCDHDGEIDFYQSGGHLDEEMVKTMPEGWDLSGSIRQPKNHLIYNKWVTFNQKITVKASTLDTWCKTNYIDAIDFIWMDVQGAEIDVFKGGTNTLNRTRFIYTEYSNNELYKGQNNLRKLAGYLKKFEIIIRYAGDVLFINRELP
ncbi:MAG TPA: FkbM family methyltransferase [Bacteroidales bacterium]|nr:FkbM family methyltransferase [Bacteroidales bacterium]